MPGLSASQITQLDALIEATKDERSRTGIFSSNVNKRITTFLRGVVGDLEAGEIDEKALNDRPAHTLLKALKTANTIFSA